MRKSEAMSTKAFHGVRQTFFSSHTRLLGQQMPLLAARVPQQRPDMPIDSGRLPPWVRCHGVVKLEQHMREALWQNSQVQGEGS